MNRSANKRLGALVAGGREEYAKVAEFQPATKIAGRETWAHALSLPRAALTGCAGLFLQDRRHMDDPPSQNRWVVYLLSILSAAFLAWAGVVWQASERLTNMLFDLHAAVSSMRTELQHIVADIDRVEQAQLRHEGQPWHQEAGRELSRIRSEHDNGRD